MGERLVDLLARERESDERALAAEPDAIPARQGADDEGA
jgi:hypothetical protein